MDFKYKHNSGSANVNNPPKQEPKDIADQMKEQTSSRLSELNERLAKIEESISSQARSFSELQIVLSTILNVVNRQGKPEYR